MKSSRYVSTLLRKSARTVAAAFSVAFVICASGCGGGTTHSLDADKAREALKTTLETWKKGESIASLATASPSITAQDFDWMSGASLLNYEVAGEGTLLDANLKVPVTLSLKTKAGRDVKKSVNYLVTTSPSLTVFRDFK